MHEFGRLYHLVNTNDFRSGAVSLVKLPVNIDPRSVAKSDSKSSAASCVKARGTDKYADKSDSETIYLPFIIYK